MGERFCLVCGGVLYRPGTGDLPPSPTECVNGVCSVGGNHSVEEARQIRALITERQGGARRATRAKGGRTK